VGFGFMCDEKVAGFLFVGIEVMFDEKVAGLTA
jgi:hypothetical protein